MIFGGWFSRKPYDERLESQRKALDEVGEAVRKASDEISQIRAQLVRKANGSLYPGLVKAGAKPRDI